MADVQHMDVEQVPIEIQVGRIIHQMKALTDEAIGILHGDSLLSSDYLEALTVRIQKYFTSELKTRKKSLYHHNLGYISGHPAKKLKKLNVSGLTKSNFIIKPKQTIII